MGSCRASFAQEATARLVQKSALAYAPSRPEVAHRMLLAGMLYCGVLEYACTCAHGLPQGCSHAATGTRHSSKVNMLYTYLETSGVRPQPFMAAVCSSVCGLCRFWPGKLRWTPHVKLPGG
jgi:hypothetical protein